MENSATQTATRQFNFDAYAAGIGDEFAEQRLEKLLAVNAETRRQKAMFRSEREMLEAALMSNPFPLEKTFAYFGLLLGTFPPAAIFLRLLIDARIFQSDAFWILGVFFIVNFISAVVGYFSGKFIGRTIRELEQVSWTKMILTLPFVGLFWGVLAGGAGGLVIFIFGAFFGALLGAAVGSVALPLFTVLHRLFKRGENIEGNQFLPFAFGITFIISAFILGL